MEEAFTGFSPPFFHAVPIDGAVAPEDIPAARSLLQLIIRNAEKINSTVDKNEAWEILEILEARPAPPEL